jgi:taurine dioxygenase
MASIKIKPLREDLSFGCGIEGVTEEVLKDENVRRQINEAFEERGVIVFENVERTDRMQMAISLVFGPLKEHPVKDVGLRDPDAMPGVIQNRITPETGDIVEIDGKQYTNWLPWHFDHCYNNELNRAGVLRAVEVPPKGCLTGFLDGIKLYHTISPELRRRIEGRSVIYSMEMRLDHMRFGKPKSFRLIQEEQAWAAIVKQAKVTPRAIHPAVWTRASKEKVFHVSPWMSEGIEGHEDSEGDALLEAVCDDINRIGQSYSYFHTWNPTDMLIWDNWRMLHSVTGCHPPQPRCMSRTTIKGDYGLGRFEDNDKGRYKILEATV